MTSHDVTYVYPFTASATDVRLTGGRATWLVCSRPGCPCLRACAATPALTTYMHQLHLPATSALRKCRNRSSLAHHLRRCARYHRAGAVYASANGLSGAFFCSGGGQRHRVVCWRVCDVSGRTRPRPLAGDSGLLGVLVVGASAGFASVWVTQRQSHVWPWLSRPWCQPLAWPSRPSPCGRTRMVINAAADSGSRLCLA